MAIEFKRMQAQRYTWQIACHAGNLPRKFRASDEVPVDWTLRVDHLNRDD
jgi:hypothetical protein